MLSKILDKLHAMDCRPESAFWAAIDQGLSVYECSHRGKPVAIWRRENDRYIARVSKSPNGGVNIMSVLRGDVVPPRYWTLPEIED